MKLPQIPHMLNGDMRKEKKKKKKTGIPGGINSLKRDIEMEALRRSRDTI